MAPFTQKAPAQPGAAASSPLIIERNPGEFSRDFDKVPFTFSHTLANDPRFSYARIVELVERNTHRADGGLHCNVGKALVNQRWRDLKIGVPSPVDVALNMENSEGWMILYHVERDPEFADVLTQCLAEIEALTGPQLRGQVYVRKAEVIISSPNRVTNYHLDYEANWLIQLHGTKTAYVFDPHDKEVLTNQELEVFFRGDRDAGVYKEHLQERAARHDMVPGYGCHMPINAPHWVQNGPTVSVSIAFNFELRRAYRRGMIHRFNGHLRRLGLSPGTPNLRSPIDQMKGLTMAGIVKLKEMKNGMRAKNGNKYK